MINFRAVGCRIRQLRKKSGMTQEVLAEKLNISSEHMSRIETGVCNASLALIERTCEIFGVHESELLFGSEKEMQLNKELYIKIEGLSEVKKSVLKELIDLLE